MAHIGMVAIPILIHISLVYAMDEILVAMQAIVLVMLILITVQNTLGNVWDLPTNYNKKFMEGIRMDGPKITIIQTPCPNSRLET